MEKQLLPKHLCAYPDAPQGNRAGRKKAQNSRGIRRVWLTVVLTILCGLGSNVFAAAGTHWYLLSSSNGDITVLSNWTNDYTGATASGTLTTFAPGSGSTYYFHIKNVATATMGASLTIGSGGGTAVIYLGDSTDAVNFTVPAAYTLTNGAAAINVSPNATLTLLNTTVPYLGVMATGSTVAYSAAGSQNVQAIGYSNLVFGGSGTRSASTVVTVNTMLAITGTSTISASPTYTSGSTLEYNTTSGYTAGYEFVSPYNVIVANTGAITLGMGSLAKTSLTINSGATLNTNNYSFGFGNFINNGTFNAGSSSISTIYGGVNTWNGFTTTGAVDVTGTCTVTLTGNMNAGSLVVTGSNSKLYLGTGLTHTTNTMFIGSGDTVLGGSSTLNLSGSGIPVTLSGTTSAFVANTGTVNYNCTSGSQSIQPMIYYNLKASGNRIKYSNYSATATQTTINNSLIINSTTDTFNLGNTLLVDGGSCTITNNGVIETSVVTTLNATPLPTGKTWGGLVEYYSSSGSETIVTGTYNNILTNYAMTLGGNVTTASLSLNGILTTGSYTLNMSSSQNIGSAGSGHYVYGNLSKAINGTSEINYEVGDATEYLPAELILNAPGTAGSLGVTVTGGSESHEGSSYISGTQNVNAYWSITNSGAAGPSTVTLKAYYNSGDVAGGSNSSFSMQKYTSGSWAATTIPCTNASGGSYSSTANTGVALGSVAGDYIFGVSNAPCYGTPTAGAAQLSPGDGGSASLFTASLLGATTASGLTYQWTMSTTSGSSGFSTITGATNSTYSFSGLTGNTWYECVLGCPSYSTSATSISGEAIYFNPAASCTPSSSQAAQACSYSAYMLSFNLTGASGSISDAAPCNGTGYVDNITENCTLNAASTYTATITTGAAVPVSVQIWIDFNGDGIFQTSESVGGSASIEGAGNNVVLTIPAGVSGGIFRMRAVADYTGDGHIYPSMDPCTSGYSYSEGRDYSITIPGGVSWNHVSGASVCVGNNILLTDATSGGTWSSTNTSVATIGTDGTVNGVSGGTSTISYAYSGGGGDIQVVTVNGAPSSTGATNNGPVCAGTGVTLYDNSTYATGWLWQGTDGSSSTLQSPAMTPTATATYSLTMTGACGSSPIYTTTVTVNPSPIVRAGGGATAIYAGGSATLTASGATSYSWLPGTGLSTTTGASVTASPTVTTTYTVTGTTGCSSIAVATVSVDALPTLASSSNCTNSLLTITSALTPAQVVIENGGVGVATLTPTYATRNTVAGGYGAGSAANQLNQPYGVTADANGNVYVADYGNARVQKWAPGATTGTTVAGVTGSAGSGTTQLYRPTDVVVDAAGNIYIADFGNARIQKWAPGATAGTTVAGGHGAGSGVTQLSSPTGVYVDDTGNVYVADLGNNRIQKWAPGATSGTTVAGGNGGGSAANQLNWPWGVAVDKSGNVFVADYQNGRVQEWAPGATTGVTVGTSINQPLQLSVDVAGDVYVAAAGASEVVMLAPGNTTGVVVASSGISDDQGIFLDANNNIYEADFGNSRVSEFIASYNPYTATTGGIYSAVAITSAGTVTTNTVTVNATPSSTGATNNGPVCAGSSVTLSDHSTGATAWTWHGSDGSSSSLQSPVMTPTANTTYSLTVSNSDGCTNSTIYTTTVTVKVAPTSTGATNSGPICKGNNVTLHDNSTHATGWTWYGSDGSSSASESPVMTPTTTTTYSLTMTNSDGCNSATVYTTVVTVNMAPSSTGASNSGPVCTGTGVTLYDNSINATGWSWHGSDGSSSASESPVMTPTATTTYSLTMTNTDACINTTVYTTIVSVNVVPSSTGATNNGPICNGGTVTLYDNSTNATGWSWAGSDGSSSTSESPVMTPTSTTTYSLTVNNSDGCNNATVYTTTVVVNTANAGTITGASSVNVGSNITLTDIVSSGSWSSGNTSVATVTDGVVNGVAAGTATISYGVTGSCGAAYATMLITVDPISVSDPGGSASICAGGTSTLTDATPGGVWSMSSDIASVVGSTGVVTGSSTLYGTATVTYTVGSLHTTVVVTVYANPTQIQGPAFQCIGTTIMLTDATANGSWSASGGATISGSGASATLTAGLVAGTAAITYTSLTTGCSSLVRTNTIYPNPDPIGGVFNLCLGSTILLTDATSATSETWSSSNSTVAVASGYHVTGESAGTAIITYMISPGSCYVTQTVTVNALPSNITGNTGPICPGATLILSDGAGVWSSSNTAVAAVGTGGNVTGVSSGMATITYTASGSSACIATTVVTINTTPAINGPGTICSSSPATLTDASAGGVWSSGNTLIATVGSTTGTVSGVSAGNVPITYTSTNSCHITTTISVTATPTTIGGATNKVCTGNTITLTDGISGGSWSSSNVSLGSIDNSGNVTGVGPGTVTITYTTGGCSVTSKVTVNALPGAINGTTSVCAGSTTTLSDATTGGTWSITGGVATIGATGVVAAGASGGTGTVSYIVTSTGCGVATVVTVNAAAGTITGNSPVCIGSNITLSDGGGTWSSSNTAVAIIGSATGTLTGETAGTSKITYTSGGCMTTTIATVSIGAGTINGVTTLSQNTTTSLSDATTGGTWTSGNNSIAIVGTNGLVSGVISGATTIATVNITYTSAGGCSTSVVVNVLPIPGAIGGSTSICAGGTTTLTDATPGGTWSAQNDYATVVGSTGVVTGSSTLYGTCTITYTVGGVHSTVVVTVFANPTQIQGPWYQCVGTSIMLTDATAGGSWSASGDASISGSGSAAVLSAGITAGTATITYTSLTTGCSALIRTNTIYPDPLPITGSFNVCTGITAEITDATSGGAWTSSNTAVATLSGFYVNGHTQGTTTITYQVPTGSCYVTQVISVNTTPTVSAISGSATISEAGGAVTLSDATAGGTWNSSNSAIIELIAGTSTPTVTAQALTNTGSVTISYTVANGWCSTRVTKSVGAAAAAHPDGGGTINTTTLYAGTAVSLGGEVSGIWSSSDNTIASVDGSGLVTAILPGNVIITHETPNDDGSVTTSATSVVVTAAPASINLIPNPNKGTFIVKGAVGSASDQEVALEVTDVLGQVIYKGKTTAFGGKLNETIILSSSLANGMYMLNVTSGTENKTIHFVIEQ